MFRFQLSALSVKPFITQAAVDAVDVISLELDCTIFAFRHDSVHCIPSRSHRIRNPGELEKRETLD